MGVTPVSRQILWVVSSLASRFFFWSLQPLKLFWTGWIYIWNNNHIYLFLTFSKEKCDLTHPLMYILHLWFHFGSHPNMVSIKHFEGALNCSQPVGQPQYYFSEPYFVYIATTRLSVTLCLIMPPVPIFNFEQFIQKKTVTSAVIRNSLGIN